MHKKTLELIQFQGFYTRLNLLCGYHSSNVPTTSLSGRCSFPGLPRYGDGWLLRTANKYLTRLQAGDESSPFSPHLSDSITRKFSGKPGVSWWNSMIASTSVYVIVLRVTHELYINIVTYLITNITH